MKTSWILWTVPKTNEKCSVVVNWFNLKMPYSKFLEGILHIIKISSSYNLTSVLVVARLFPEKTNLLSKSCLRNWLFLFPSPSFFLSSPVVYICLAYEKQQKTMFSSRSLYIQSHHFQRAVQTGSRNYMQGNWDLLSLWAIWLPPNICLHRPACKYMHLIYYFKSRTQEYCTTSQVFLESIKIFQKLGFMWMKTVTIWGSFHLVLPHKFPIVCKRHPNPTSWLHRY